MTQQLGRHTRQHHKLRAALQNRPERMKSSTSAASVCVAAAVLASAQAFVGPSFLQRPSASGSEVSRPHSCAQPLSMFGSGIASTKVGKKKVIDEVTELLSKSSLVFSIPSSGIKANDVVRFRKEMPEGCTAKVVKNTLMRKASENSPFEILSEITTGENFWMFVEGDENLAAPIKYIGTFAKTMDTENEAWKSPMKMGVYEGNIQDAEALLAISALPTKQELMQRLAFALNSVPTKIARSINLVPTKVGRVVRLAFAEGEGGEEGAGESDAAAPAEVKEAAAEPEADAATEEAPAAPEGDAPADAEAPAAE